MKAIILAGGFGTRLRSIIADLPKPMAPIQDKPFLAYLLEYLHQYGVDEVVLSVHYLKDVIQEYFQNTYRGIKISYAIEEKPLGTGGAIVHALSFIETQEPIFVLNGDTFLKVNYSAMLREHKKTNPLITLALRKVADCNRYGTVNLEHNKIVSFQEKGRQGEGLINAGVYLISPNLFKDFSLPDTFSIENDFIFKYINDLNAEAFVVDDYFIDIGIPEDYQRALTVIPAKAGIHKA